MNPFSPLLVLAALGAPNDSQFSPPGLVLVEGGKTQVGLDVDAAEELIKEHEGMIRAIWAETPQQQMDIDDFYLMVTEVTNEQYAEFVRATGSKPPRSWGAKAMDEGRMAFLNEEGLKRKEARDKGEPVPERKTFDPEVWWDRNWEEAEWEIPEGRGNHAVTYVDFSGAESYARWAGMRLMTEFEYQCAVRGRTENTFSWGNDWDDKKFAHTVHFGLDDTLPVGSFPAGATSQGIHDLMGGVWEWTASPFTQFEKNKPARIRIGKGSSKRDLEAYGDYDPNQRVSVGGSYRTEAITARVTVRRGTERIQATDAIGFRCASSVQPGADMAETVLRVDLPPSLRPEDVEYDADNTLAMDRWHTKSGTSEVPGYSVITGYDSVLFIPTTKLPIASKKKLVEESVEEGPVHVGVVYTTEEILVPALTPGTYAVAFRGAGEANERKKKGKDTDEEETSNDWLGAIDVELDNYLFFDADGNFVSSVVADEYDFGKYRAPSITVDRVRKPEDPDEAAKLEEQGVVIIERDIARFSIFIEGNSKRSGYLFGIPLGMKPGAVDASWRK